jgi:argininosuccinate synthase
LYEGVYLLGTSRVQSSRKQIEIAKEKPMPSTRPGNDRVRFELTYYAAGHQVVPWREWEFKGRADRSSMTVFVTATAKPWRSMDRNLMHISYEGGILEDP